MSTFQQLVVMYSTMTADRGRYKPGVIYYPEALHGQDINVVLATYGQQGYEVIGQEVVQNGIGVAIVLKKSS